MRTTIDIPDKLMKKVKIKAAEDGITLKELFIKSLKAEVDVNIKTHAERLKELRNLGNADNLNPEDSAFDLIYHEINPANQEFFVNDPSKDVES